MLRLYKKEKLCSTVAISALFGHAGGVSSMLAYPVKALWRPNPGRRSDSPIQFLISVPKRRLRHAVDRVTMRRRMREAYRLHHQQYPMQGRTDLILVYVANSLLPYAKVEDAICRILAHLSTEQQTAHTATQV